MQSRARQHDHVLAVPAEEPATVAGDRHRVAVDRERRHLTQHLVDRDAVAFDDTQVCARTQARDAAHGLVPGHDGKRAGAGDQLHALVLRDVAPAQADGFDLQQRATLGWVRDRELAYLVAAVTREHDCTARLGHVDPPP